MEEDVKLTKLAKCAGCGAKVGAGVLAKLLSDLPTLRDDHLLIGFDKSDDAAVYQIADDKAIVQTLDFFPPIADDPYTFGQIAATNALSDVYAMGGEPKLALNIMCVPKSMSDRSVHEILRGGYEKCAEAGAIICGGHSIFDDEPKYGLSVTGFVHPGKVWKNHGAKPGDVLFLTKPLGIGVLTAAQKGDLLNAETKDQMIQLMTTLNKSARDILTHFSVHACTDVTGFSFLGHLYEMCSGSNVTAEIDTARISLIPEALDFARIGILPEGMYRNRSFAEHAVDCGSVELAVCDLLFDPQTSGGLLVAVPAKESDDVFNALSGHVPCVQKVGKIIDKREKSIYLI